MLRPFASVDPIEGNPTGALDSHAELHLLSPGARRIVLEAVRKNVSVADLVELARGDPAFAARVLSVTHGAGSELKEFRDLDRACTVLGVRGLRNVALAMLVTDLIPAAEGAATLLSICLRRASLAGELARESGTVEPEDAFCAGLLLEVGLLHQACDHFEDCLDAARTPARHRLVRERAAGLVPHPRRGVVLARELNLPRVVCEAIVSHHAASQPESPLAAICWAAELAAGALEAGDSIQHLRLAESACDVLGIDKETLRRILDATPNQVQKWAQTLECPAGTPESRREIQRPSDRSLREMQQLYEGLVHVLERVIEERDHLAAQLSALDAAREQRMSAPSTEPEFESKS